MPQHILPRWYLKKILPNDWELKFLHKLKIAKDGVLKLINCSKTNGIVPPDYKIFCHDYNKYGEFENTNKFINTSKDDNYFKLEFEKFFDNNQVKPSVKLPDLLCFIKNFTLYYYLIRLDHYYDNKKVSEINENLVTKAIKFYWNLNVDEEKIKKMIRTPIRFSQLLPLTINLVDTQLKNKYKFNNFICKTFDISKYKIGIGDYVNLYVDKQNLLKLFPTINQFEEIKIHFFRLDCNKILIFIENWSIHEIDVENLNKWSIENENMLIMIYTQQVITRSRHYLIWSNIITTEMFNKLLDLL